MCCGQPGCKCKTQPKWIQKAMSAKGKKGAPRGAGTLTAQAKEHNMSVAAFAKNVEANPDKYYTITKQRVQMYRNMTKK